MGNIGNITGIGNLSQSGQGGATDSFIKLTVDMTGITPTTQTYKGKTYNKFVFTVNNLTINSISPLGDVETIAINDALIYNLLPLSNSNDDKGIHVEYSNNTFTGYVLSTESTLTTVNFMFSYYLDLTKTSILWENYIDMILGGGSNNLYRINVVYKVPETGAYITFYFYSSQTIDSHSTLVSYMVGHNITGMPVFGVSYYQHLLFARYISLDNNVCTASYVDVTASTTSTVQLNANTYFSSWEA